MTDELQRSNLVQTALLATISISATAGLWSGLSRVMPLTGVIGIPLLWVTFTGLLLMSTRIAVRRGYEAGLEGAQIDSVTRLPSVAVAKRVLAVEFAAAERGRVLSLVCFSIDDYPQLVATHGATEAKRLLIGMGTMLRRRTRNMHMSCRYGDNGVFFSILGGVPPEGALIFANKVNKDVAGLRIAGKPVTVSTSVCTYDTTIHSPDELLAKGQRALADTRRKGGIKLVTDVDDGMGEHEGYAVLAQ